MEALIRALSYKGIPLWRHVQVVQWTTQIVSGVLVVVLVVWFFANIGNAIQDREIPSGFGFLDREYQTPIGHSFLSYDSSDSFLYAFVVAFVNTLLVSVVGVILATALGIAVGVARISGNWLVSKIALAYIEFFRNVPLLVQLFFWFYIVVELPVWQDSYSVADLVFLNNRYLAIPFLSPSGLVGALVWVLVSVGGIGAAIFAYRRLIDREVRTGSAAYPILSGFAITFLVGALAWGVLSVATGDAPFSITVPNPQEPFGRVEGGFVLPGALITLMVGLVMYTAAFIAEIVRAGLQSVSRGQRESARALGLSGMTALRHVTFPQALRVIVPPLISQYLNLTKNSSLAGAIGYSDLTNVAKTMTQTAPAVSIFLMVMIAYLVLSLTYSLIGNLYNRHIRF
ncbi:MAG: ABC transporter permease subunit [Dehalococcoidia bacterium]|nr:ABC transporter permease subunit [Dehalococcoidia bacterium]